MSEFVRHMFYITVLFVGAFASGYVCCHLSCCKPKEEFDLVLPVVDGWGGTPENPGEEVGKLYIKTGEKPDLAFVFKGDTCKYGGAMAWDGIGRAMNKKGPLFSVKVLPEK